MAAEKFVKFKRPDSKGFLWGIVSGKICRVIEGDPLAGFSLTERKLPIDKLEILSPVNPSKIICIGLNYSDHAEELGMDIPKEPLFFLKAPSAVTGPGKKIFKPDLCSRLDYEAELGIVIKKRCKNITEREADDYILGYTCFNDVTARDIQKKESQWARAKSFDTFAPAGPYIAVGIFPDNLAVKLRLNGKLKQDSSTSKMIFPVFKLLSYLSENMTLLPGDLIAAGTPPGVGSMEPGDRVEIEIDGIGKLVNYVEREK